jgi:GNAT superfamily N-acetyltransferase
VDERATIRNASEGEGEEILALVRDAYEEFLPLLPADAAAEFRTDMEDTARRARFTDLVVAEHEGRVVGAVWYYRDGSGYHERWPVGWAAFRLLVVAPSARGLGIGRALVEECVRRAEASGCAAIGMHTLPFMQDARRLYERMGFPPVPALSGEYVPGVEVIGYLKELEPGASALFAGGGPPGGGGAGHGE